MTNNRTILPILLSLVVASYFAFAVIRLAPGGDWNLGSQRDFQMYYNAAKAYLQGLNPYDRQIVEEAIGPTPSEFFYFPLSLQLLSPMTRLPYNRAALIFIFIKCFLLVYLISIWHAVFLDKTAIDPWFLLFCLLAFNSTIYLDLRAGNVSIVEQAMLWTSFYFFLRRQYILFSVFLVLSAFFKLTPLFFGLLILWYDKTRRFRAGIALTSVVTVAVGLTWLTDPALLLQFVPHSLKILELPSESGIINPSLLPLVKGLLVLFVNRGWIVYSSFLQWALYFSAIVAIAVLTWSAFRKLDSFGAEDSKWVINLMCLLFVLVTPRMKDYSYIVLLVPTYFVIERMSAVKAYPFIFVLCVLSAQHITLPGLDSLARVLWAYYPFGIAFLVWIVYLSELRARDRRRISP